MELNMMNRTVTTLLLFFATLPVYGITWPSDGTVTGHNYAGGSVQWVHDNQTQDDDTITIPTGVFSWATELTLTKGITLQGHTIVSGDHQ